MDTHCLVSPNATPFIIKVSDAILLESSEGFSILREHLANACPNDLCKDHATNNPEDQQSWLVMRDILHALLAPVVHLFDNTVRVARKATGGERPEELEYAYRGRARTAFVWLQSFLDVEEEDWCLSRDCPACIVEHALDAEFPIRLIIAAGLLSEMDSNADYDRPTLPSFAFFLNSFRDALDEDELWGPDYFDYIEPKAYGLKLGMQALIRQSAQLEINMTPPVTPEETPLPTFCYFTGATPVSTVNAGMPIKRSKLAKKQLRMKKEEEQWVEQMVQACWRNLNPSNPSLPESIEAVLSRMSTVGGP
ncbi:hypothetical protein M8818_001262 [Zalaria obscura]|uniref:Uncharacterized protein n=1 Tax=Zalaria obscura TaxID=2024903 RepID=A0ACC3SKN8_9PEZI